MPKSRIASSTPADTFGGSRDILKQEFGRRLSRVLLDHPGGPLTQSDLARATGLGRDAISTYCRGRSFPEPSNLKRICDALDKKVEELVPEMAAAQEDVAHPTMAITSTSDPNRLWLRVNQPVTPKQARAVMAILDSAADER